MDSRSFIYLWLALNVEMITHNYFTSMYNYIVMVIAVASRMNIIWILSSQLSAAADLLENSVAYISGACAAYIVQFVKPFSIFCKA